MNVKPWYRTLASSHEVPASREGQPDVTLCSRGGTPRPVIQPSTTSLISGVQSDSAGDCSTRSGATSSGYRQSTDKRKQLRLDRDQQSPLDLAWQGTHHSGLNSSQRTCRRLQVKHPPFDFVCERRLCRVLVAVAMTLSDCVATRASRSSLPHSPSWVFIRHFVPCYGTRCPSTPTV